VFLLPGKLLVSESLGFVVLIFSNFCLDWRCEAVGRAEGEHWDAELRSSSELTLQKSNRIDIADARRNSLEFA
jgi:hypothetical protein